LFQAFARTHSLHTALVHDAIRNPTHFIDTCHMTPEGIEQLARAFLPVVSKLVEARLGG
jgi:lysophospholipase L1-like esterase